MEIVNRSLLERCFDIWENGATDTRSVTGFPEWPDPGGAVVGDFSGIQNFVYRPVPGVGGVARRLRSRSFRVSPYTQNRDDCSMVSRQSGNYR